MKFWPLIIAILGSGYYATWHDRWYLPVGAAILVMLLLWATSFGVLGITVGALLTLILSPLLYAVFVLMYARFH